ncbi:MAG: hypothetical protein ABS873_02725 [Alkalibacterium sp.]
MMSRKTTQILSLGLLVSSVVVMGIEVWSPQSSGSSSAQSSENLTAQITELENKIEALEEENSQISAEHDRLSEGYANSLTMEELEELEDIDAENTEADEETSSSETTNAGDSDSDGDVRQFTITVKDGEPSSVIADQLVYHGLIEDRFAFNDYLEDNDLASKVRPGNYVVSSDMNESELAQAIIQ